MTDFANMRMWSDEDATSTNPICLDDMTATSANPICVEDVVAQKNKGGKKSRNRRSKKYSGEDSSVADSMLSSILSDSDDLKIPILEEKEYLVPQTNYHETREREKQRRREKLEELKSRRNAPKKQVQPMRASLYPSSDEESDANDDLSKNPFSDNNEAAVSDDDLSKNPFSNKAAANKNPFENDGAYSDSEESSTIRPPPLDAYFEEQAKMPKSTNPFADEEEESDEGDIIESSRRLLRCVDQRIQYQQQNDDVRQLKAQLKQMKTQAEAMAEQLRRAVETKCDLVLAQNEMERNHEQGLIAKDAELKDLRLYIQEILEQQAQSELNFMNEISSLARQMEFDKKKHAREIENKESKISKLENKIDSMRVTSAPDSPIESFRSRFSKGMFVNPSYE